MSRSTLTPISKKRKIFKRTEDNWELQGSPWPFDMAIGILTSSQPTSHIITNFLSTTPVDTYNSTHPHLTTPPKSSPYLRPVGQARLKHPRLSKFPKQLSTSPPLLERSLPSPKLTPPLLAACHICHRRPTTKHLLDSYADCAHCGSRSCYVCLRQCEGVLCGQKRRVCSQCCVERGEEGAVSCLECLEIEFRASAERKENMEDLEGIGVLEGEMGRTVDWVLRQQELRKF
ncbi:MAG: hypothetical protein M1830_001353 [Pleopsidium flavum]|nr:MAG: hypothetical protein M1830_001353 [Pleopsidium flavum]